MRRKRGAARLIAHGAILLATFSVVATAEGSAVARPASHPHAKGAAARAEAFRQLVVTRSSAQRQVSRSWTETEQHFARIRFKQVFGCPRRQSCRLPMIFVVETSRDFFNVADREKWASFRALIQR